MEVFDVPLSDVRELSVGRGIAFGTFKILVGNVRYLFHDVNPQWMHHNFTKLADTLVKGISATIDVKAWRAELMKQMEALKSDKESRDAPFSAADIVELAGMGKMFARFENWLFRKG